MQAGVSKGGKRVRGSCTGLVLLCNSDAVSLALVWSAAAAAAACAQAGHAASVLLQVQVGCGLSGNNCNESMMNVLLRCTSVRTMNDRSVCRFKRMKSKRERTDRESGRVEGKKDIHGRESTP
jgi:hypothetical protein